jgi:hypothetical protein
MGIRWSKGRGVHTTRKKKKDVGRRQWKNTPHIDQGKVFLSFFGAAIRIEETK